MYTIRNRMEEGVGRRREKKGEEERMNGGVLGGGGKRNERRNGGRRERSKVGGYDYSREGIKFIKISYL